MDAYSFDLVYNPDRLLNDFNLSTLKPSLALRNGMPDIKAAEASWDVFTQTLSSIGVSPECLGVVGDLLRLHGENKPLEDPGPRACFSCEKDSFVPIVSPVCGHVMCVRCLLGQERAQQPGSSSARVYERRDWTREALERLEFTCGCKRAFSMGQLCENPSVCFIPHGLSYRGSPKLVYVLKFIREHPGEKVRGESAKILDVQKYELV
jgi:hypothetical protein